MDSFVKSGAKQRKQSGMEEEFKEKEQLLESLRGRFMDKDQKQAAKIKEKENREKGEKLHDDTMQTLKEKNRYEEEEPRSRKRKVFDVEKIWNEKKALRDEEL